MSRRWLLSLFCLSVPLLLFVQLTRARGVLTVNEAATRFLLRDAEPLVSLAVENPSGKSLDVMVQLELLDPDGHSRTATKAVFKLGTGSQKLLINLPIKIAKLSSVEQDQLLWYRLRYHVAPAAGEDVAAAAGVISLSEMTPDLFQIRVASSRTVRAGMRYRATVRAQHPLSNRPARAVRLEGTVEFEPDDSDKKTTLKAYATTDHDGFAVLDFELPRQIKTDSIDLAITARRGSLVVREDRRIDLDQQPYIFVTTDKPMYQPGQMLHARVLIFGPSKRAIGNTAVTLKISDPENDSLFEKELTTSRFGVASADWPIPENSRLGNYRVEFETQNEKSSSASVKVSRYDLPNFTVDVKPDRSFYLPKQNARVEVAAGYLFGQPVKRGHVRVVRETERTWNYREQKYDTKEREKYEGDSDTNGVFTANIDLKAEQDKLGEEDYERFRDLSYAAYFTDPTTNRTEQRRFDLRITRESIHLYIIKPGAEYDESSKLPLQFYLSTFYADGTPAPCRVAISGSLHTKGEFGRVLRSVKTNRYGVAKIERMELPEDFRNDGDLTLNFFATDSRGKTGKHAEGFYLRDQPALRVETDKTLYRKGEPIAITLTSSEREMTTLLEVVRDSVVVHSEIVRIRDGKALMTLPWNEEFRDELTISAFVDLGREDRAISTHTILYPRNRDLKLGVFSNHQTYRPGADAQVNFRVRDPRGHSAESALGVVVFDKAVEERARTDQEFGASSSDNYREILRWLGNGDSLAGVGRKELQKIDLSQAVDPELELTAEIMLNQNRSYYPGVFGGDNYETSQARVFLGPIKSQLKPVRDALQAFYERTREYPTDEPALRRILSEATIDYPAMHDPWGIPYRSSFFIDNQVQALTLTSAGADKRFDTSDDFVVEKFGWSYFRSTGEAIDRAAHDYHARTGGFIRDQKTLSEELGRLGIKQEALVDRWSHPYKLDFSIGESRFLISVTSAGPNGRFESAYPNDDFNLWTSGIDYFAEARMQIDRALDSWVRARNLFPQNEAELRAALRGSGVSLEGMRDPWNRAYYSVFSVEAFYGDRAKIDTHSNYGETPTERIQVKPVSKRIIVVKLRSAGADGHEGTADDFGVASFGGTVSDQAGSEIIPQKPDTVTTFSGSTGAIRGVAVDPNGASVAGANVTATRTNTTQTFEAKTDDEGRYVLRNLPVGLYSIRIESPGFQAYVVDNIFVHSSNVVEVNAMLSVGAVAAAVTVVSEISSVVNAESATVSTTVRVLNNLNLAPGAARSKAQLATPRLREYFPETLLWQPSLETDRQGRAQINFKLADNITTWKMAVIGSTEDGQLGTVEKEFKSFQPFFVEHDPPRVLTEGDEISLPVVVRNYLPRTQAVDLDIKPENWFALLGPAHKRTAVPAGDATRETFDLRAVGSVKNGKQRITATAADDNDAIEKPVTVHPNGEEQTVSASDAAGDLATLDLKIPESVIPNSVQAELKIYPNLLGHVTESVEAIMKRPYGCGEQTISSTYPSLLLLKHYKQTNANADGAMTKASGADVPLKRAEHYLNEGYTRLLNYRDSSGGFTYWGHGNPDVALTAYALRFLHDASELIEVDSDVTAKASAWLVKQQTADGGWLAHYYWNNLEDTSRTEMLTAYVARVLAAIQKQKNLSVTAGHQNTPQKAADESIVLRRALDHLARRANQNDEPYLLAAYALASFDSGDVGRASTAIAKLRALAHTEGNTTYWSLETNTPFYGWGTAGRVETTALVVQALARSTDTEPEAVATGSLQSPDSKSQAASTSSRSLTPSPNSPESIPAGSQPSANATPAQTVIAKHPAPAPPAHQTNDTLVRSGLLFLLKQKDRYGVWYSTQATINVLDAMLLLLQTDAHAANGANSQNLAEIIVNGQVLAPVSMPPENQSGNPITIDVSRYLRVANNRIEIRRSPGSSAASVQAVANYYVPWPASSATRDTAVRAGNSDGLRLIAKFDSTAGQISDEITCHVEAERVGFRGYGMLLAEIGLPPGADVDRASLQTAMKSSGWAINQYDVLPDRVVIYLWPQAGGVKFDFKFRPRFGLQARSAPSLVYDYYNPDARAVVSPVLFTIR